MAKKKNNLDYVEPKEYFPEEIRKKYGLGEYADENSEDMQYLKGLLRNKKDQDETEKENQAFRDYIKKGK